MAGQARDQGGNQGRLALLADGFVLGPVTFSFDLALGTVEHAVAVAQTVFPFTEVATPVAQHEEALAMVQSMHEIAYVALAVGENIGALAMGLPVP